MATEMSLPASCWVLTEDAPPHIIKDASPEWFLLWDLPKEESVGKPISILNDRSGSDLEAASLLMANFKRDGHAKVRARILVKRDYVNSFMRTRPFNGTQTISSLT